MGTSSLRRLPVTVVTGFLGAGKSTLLRQLLLTSGLRLAVLVNEFGEVGIDGDLIRSCGFCPEDEQDTRVVELANGCLCCTVQDDFLPTMETLLAQADRLDGIVVETSGLALPEPLVQAFQWPAIRHRTRVSGVITMVDGEALAGGSVVADPSALEAQREADPSLDHLTAFEDLFQDQLDAADLVLLSRADCLDAATVATLREQLGHKVRAGVEVLPVARGCIAAHQLLGLDRPDAGFEPSKEMVDAGHDHGHHDHDHDHHHDHTHVPMQSAVVRLTGHVDRQRLDYVLRDLIEAQAILRLKGRAWLPGKVHPLQIQAVGPRLECWFESHGNPSASGAPAPGLEVVALALQLDRAELEAQLRLALV